MINICKGNVYWINLHEKTDENSIPHPHVIIDDSFIDTVIVCGITTNMKKINWPGNILLEAGEANLAKKSIVDVSQVYSVEKTQLGNLSERSIL